MSLCSKYYNRNEPKRLDPEEVTVAFEKIAGSHSRSGLASAVVPAFRSRSRQVTVVAPTFPKRRSHSTDIAHCRQDSASHVSRVKGTTRPYITNEHLNVPEKKGDILTFKVSLLYTCLAEATKSLLTWARDLDYDDLSCTRCLKKLAGTVEKHQEKVEEFLEDFLEFNDYIVKIEHVNQIGTNYCSRCGHVDLKYANLARTIAQCQEFIGEVQEELEATNKQHGALLPKDR